jgi:pimeloyl-ACP methyl ester carboxylesterase
MQPSRFLGTGSPIPILLLSSLAACAAPASETPPREAPMSAYETSTPATFVMVHSAWLGGWAWEPVARVLEERGHRVIAPDLPAHGHDRTPPAQASMDAYVRTVTDLLDAQREPVILVGHSLGGIVISQAAQERPEKVRSLVYLCAFLLPDGGSFLAATRGVQGSMVLDNLVMAEDQSYVTIREDVVHQAFAHDVPAEAFERVRPLTVPEPTAPLAAPLSITEERWGRVPRYYIECTEDRAIPPAVQRAMYTAIPVERVFSIAASHAPNFSAPEQVADYLLEVAAATSRIAAR